MPVRNIVQPIRPVYAIAQARRPGGGPRIHQRRFRHHIADLDSAPQVEATSTPAEKRPSPAAASADGRRTSMESSVATMTAVAARSAAIALTPPVAIAEKVKSTHHRLVMLLRLLRWSLAGELEWRGRVEAQFSGHAVAAINEAELLLRRSAARRARRRRRSSPAATSRAQAVRRPRSRRVAKL